MENSEIMTYSSITIENIKVTSKSVKSLFIQNLTTQVTIQYTTIPSNMGAGINLYAYGHSDVTKTPESISQVTLLQENNFSRYRDQNGDRIEISFANNSALTGGYYYNFYLSEKDSLTSLEDLISIDGHYLCGRAPTGPIGNFTILKNSDQSGVKKDGYFSDKVKVTYRFKEKSISEKQYYAEIAEAHIYVRTKDVSSGKPILATNTENVEVILDTSWVPWGEEASFDFEIVDTIGNIRRLAASDVLTATKTSQPVFINEQLDFSPDPLDIYTNTQDIIIKHSYANASGTKTFLFNYIIVGNGNNQKIPADQIKVDNTNQNLITVTISKDSFKNIISNLFGSSEGQTSCIFQIQAIDGFGTSIQIQKNITINFDAPPVFVQKLFTLKHDFIVNRQGIGTDIGTLINSSSKTDLRMFNKDEGLIFVLPQVDIPNQNNEVVEYNIYISRNTILKNQSGPVSIDAAVFGQAPWLTISYDTLLNGLKDDNYFYYRHKFSQYTQNEQLYFKVQAKDNKGLTTEMLTCSDYIYGCRTVAPIFSLSDVPITRNGNTVILDLSKFSITDLGGSATAEGWDLDFYSRYPNFERNIDGYSRRAQLKIELASTQDFDSETITILATFVPGEEKSLVDFKLTSATTDQFSSSYSKIFMRFTLTVSYGLDSNNNDEFFKGLATISSVPQIVTYFGNVPTVSHRSHNVGINTNSMTDEDVLVIENYQNRKYVKLVGIGGTLNTITINLSTGEVSGMTLSGGTWDEI